MTDRIPAEVFPPGEFIQEELDARGWMQEDLARIVGCTVARINEIIKGKRGISDETAVALGEAFGTGAEYWMRLEGTYRLSRVRPSSDTVARRARLYSMAPMRELVKRHWIEPHQQRCRYDELHHGRTRAADARFRCRQIARRYYFCSQCARR